MFSGLLLTSIATIGSAIFHPFAPLLFAYDWYVLARHMSNLNSMVEFIWLRSEKTRVEIQSLNFLGYLKKHKAENGLPINKFAYIGEYQNPYLRANEWGMLPSMHHLLR